MTRHVFCLFFFLIFLCVVECWNQQTDKWIILLIALTNIADHIITHFRPPYRPFFGFLIRWTIINDPLQNSIVFSLVLLVRLAQKEWNSAFERTQKSAIVMIRSRKSLSVIKKMFEMTFDITIKTISNGWIRILSLLNSSPHWI